MGFSSSMEKSAHLTTNQIKSTGGTLLIKSTGGSYSSRIQNIVVNNITKRSIFDYLIQNLRGTCTFLFLEFKKLFN